MSHDQDSPRESVPPPPTYLFPPALVGVLRDRIAHDHPSLIDTSDELLVELLTVVHFAGLETHEGVHYPIKVAFAGSSTADVVLPEGDSPGASPMLLYRWSALRIEPSRRFCVAELNKLSVVTRSERTYIKVAVSAGGRQRIVGLVREGQNREGDPYLKVVASRPGWLSIGCGQEELVDYASGKLHLTLPDVVLEPGPVRRVLETAARHAKLGDATRDDYLATVRALVREMASHGRGGILVFSGEANPALPATASYQAQNESAIAQLLEHLDGAAAARQASTARPSDPSLATQQLRQLLRNAFVNEAERWISELGQFTAMDGATVLDSGLGLRGFGVVLPVHNDVDVVRASDTEASEVSELDMSTRGTRHRAAATYAMAFPRSVVFVASHDGPVSCLLADAANKRVLLWRVGANRNA